MRRAEWAEDHLESNWGEERRKGGYRIAQLASISRDRVRRAKRGSWHFEKWVIVHFRKHQATFAALYRTLNLLPLASSIQSPLTLGKYVTYPSYAWLHWSQVISKNDWLDKWILCWQWSIRQLYWGCFDLQTASEARSDKAIGFLMANQ